MKLAKPSSKHLLWPDLIRIVAMAGVVVIHAFKLPNYDLPLVFPFSVLSLVGFVIAKTCVPLFLMLSGSLLLDKVEPDRVFLFKRLRRILIPWLIWTGIFLVTKYLPNLTSLTAGLKTFRQIFTAEFSFLPVLFCLYLLIPYLKTLVRNTSYLKQVVLVGLWFLGVSLLPYLRDSMAFPAVVDNGLVRQTINYSGYLILGWLIQLATTKYLALQGYWQWIMMLGWLTVGATSFLYITHPESPQRYLSYVAPMIILTSVISFYLLILLGKTLQKKIYTQKILSSVVAKLSFASFGVFFSHPLIILGLETFIFKNVRPATVEHNLAMSGLAIIGSFGLVMLLNKIKFLGKLVS